MKKAHQRRHQDQEVVEEQILGVEGDQSLEMVVEVEGQSPEEGVVVAGLIQVVEVEVEAQNLAKEVVEVV